jgi:MscS family membrane protein
MDILNFILFKTNEYILSLGINTGLIIKTLLIMFSIYIFKKIFNKIIFKGIILYINSLLDNTLHNETINNISRLTKPINLLFNITIFHLFIKNLMFFLPFYHILFYILYLGAFSWIGVIIVDSLFSLYLYHKEEITRSELITISSKFIKFMVFLSLFLVFLHSVGVNITTLIASLGIIGMAVALAAKDTLSNLFSSFSIIMDNPFSQKDWIKTKNVEGTVVEIGLRSTTIRSFDNALITVPNSELASGHIQNLTRRAIGRKIKLDIGISYNSNKANIKKALKEIKKMLVKHSGIAYNELKEQQTIEKKENSVIAFEDKEGIKDRILVNLVEPTSSGLTIRIYAFSKTIDWQEWLDIQEDIIFKILDICEKNDLKLAFPSQPASSTIIDQTETPIMQPITVPKEQVKEQSPTI